MTWFSWVAWSVRADLLCSVKLDARRLLVNVRPVLDSTSVLCSCNLTPNFLGNLELDYRNTSIGEVCVQHSSEVRVNRITKAICCTQCYVTDRDIVAMEY